MIDREKVIEELERLSEWFFLQYQVVYDGDAPDYYDAYKIVDDALALLKEQEPQKVINRYTKWNSVLMGNCPKCNAVLHEFDNAKACGVCGQKVEWK